MAPAYAAIVSLKIRSINVKAQKIDNSTFQIFDIAPASFWVNDKFIQSRFFGQPF